MATLKPKPRERLYPTVKELRELEELKRKFGLQDTPLGKSGNA